MIGFEPVFIKQGPFPAAPIKIQGFPYSLPGQWTVLRLTERC